MKIRVNLCSVFMLELPVLDFMSIKYSHIWCETQFITHADTSVLIANVCVCAVGEVRAADCC